MHPHRVAYNQTPDDSGLCLFVHYTTNAGQTAKSHAPHGTADTAKQQLPYLKTQIFKEEKE